MKNIAVIIRGPSGVGKSTIASMLHKRMDNAACIDIDLLKHMIGETSSAARTEIAHNVAQYFTTELIGRGYNVILEELFRDEHYNAYRDLFHNARYELVSIFLTAPLSELIARDRARTHKVKGVDVITRLHTAVVPRDGDIVIDVTQLSNDEIVARIFEKMR